MKTFTFVYDPSASDYTLDLQEFSNFRDMINSYYGYNFRFIPVAYNDYQYKNEIQPGEKYIFYEDPFSGERIMLFSALDYQSFNHIDFYTLLGRRYSGLGFNVPYSRIHSGHFNGYPRQNHQYSDRNPRQRNTPVPILHSGNNPRPHNVPIVHSNVHVPTPPVRPVVPHRNVHSR